MRTGSNIDIPTTEKLIPKLLLQRTHHLTKMSASLQSSKIGFIGGGNMAAAIIGGLLTKLGSGFKQNITVSEPWDVNRDKMVKLGVSTTISNIEASHNADILVLAVKPQVARTVCQELFSASGTSHGKKKLPLIISIAAGITLESLREWCTSEMSEIPHIVRVMPNTPALVGEGASGLFADTDVTDSEKDLATALVESVSKATEWVNKEELLDVVTGLSGKLLSWSPWLSHQTET